jgi:hypothetical protein
MKLPSFIAGALVLTLVILLPGCSSTGTLASFTPAQTAHIDYVAATAALNDATAVASVKGLSASDVVKIQAGGAAFEAAVEAQVSALTTSASVTSEIESAAAAAISTAASQLGTILTAEHGSSATATDLAVAGGLEAIEQLPAVVTAVISVQNGFAPAATDLATDLAAMQAANAALQAVTAGS